MLWAGGASRQSGRRTWCLCALLLGWMLTGCASAPQSSRIAVEDYEAMAAAMAASLRASGAIAQRTPGSETWVVSFDRVRNLSSEVMPSGEQWWVVANVRGAQPMRALWDDKRIQFVTPGEHARALKPRLDAEGVDTDFGGDRAVTHTITATFRSVTRADAMDRTDLYGCEFRMLDLRTGEDVWNDWFEFKRQAHGHVWD